MKVYTYSQVRQNLSEVLNRAKVEPVLVKRRGGDLFTIVPQKKKESPFDVPGVKTNASTGDILEAIREGRSKYLGE
ncbi:MAG: type II toxin-antitoxin system Phd/YefM family antitoxin [Kiritimatiellae bacterium]|nr:type II toxin-antitoxin system Phd/YefM family antitoxin [Kiritimatiellia bacterium]